MPKQIDHSDEEILRAFREGDEKTFRDLFIQLYPVICYHSLQYTGDQLVSEDIAEETFIKIWNKKADFFNLKQLKAFMYSSAGNASIDWIRRTHRQKQGYKAWEVFQDNKEKNAFDILAESEVFRELHKAVDSLSPQTKNVIKMTFFEGKKNKEVADELGITISTVKNLKAHGLKKLKGKLPVIAFAILIAMQD